MASASTDEKLQSQQKESEPSTPKSTWVPSLSRLSRVSETSPSLAPSENVGKPVPTPAEEDPFSTLTLTRSHQWMFAAAVLGIWGPISIFTHRTTLFVIYYQADVSSLSIIGVVMGFWDAFNGPFLARFADAGIVNRLPCFPAARWGRRAPLMLMGTPLMLLGPTVMWLAPSRDRTVLAFWYALCYFLMVNGVTVTLQSYLASIQELFPTGGERAIAVVRQTPFIVLTYILGGALPYVIAFGATPASNACDLESL